LIEWRETADVAVKDHVCTAGPERVSSAENLTIWRTVQQNLALRKKEYRAQPTQSSPSSGNYFLLGVLDAGNSPAAFGSTFDR
jgi:hypothetical protein